MHLTASKPIIFQVVAEKHRQTSGDVRLPVRASSGSMSCGAMPPEPATRRAQTSAIRSAVPATTSMCFVLNVSTTSAMSRVSMSALLSWFSECYSVATAVLSVAKRTGAHGCWRGSRARKRQVQPTI